MFYIKERSYRPSSKIVIYLLDVQVFRSQHYIYERANVVLTMLESVESILYTRSSPRDVFEEKKQIVKNLYLSNIAEEFIAMQVDLEIPMVIGILKELDVYKGEIDDEREITLVNHRV
jgi:hypothetical protein